MDMLAPVVLLVTFRIDAEQILVRYSVENKSGGEIFLVNHLTRYEKDKGWIPDASIVYSFIDPQGKIEIAKRVPPAPENRLVTPRNYYVTPLADGDRFEEELVLPLPLHENRPYDPLIEPLAEPREMDASLSFSLGYFEALPHIEARQVVVHGVPALQIGRRKSAADTSSPTNEPPADDPKKPTMPLEKVLHSQPEKVRLAVVALR